MPRAMKIIDSIIPVTEMRAAEFPRKRTESTGLEVFRVSGLRVRV